MGGINNILEDMSKGEKILVTGATGFVGANLIRRLVQTNNNLHLFIRPKSNNIWRIENVIDKLNIYEVDIQDKRSVKRAILKVKPKVIFHLATFGAYPNEDDFENIFNTNTVATVNLINACSTIGFDSFINTGSSSEYGVCDTPMTEGTALSPVTDYGSTKAATTIILEQIARSRDLNIATIRPFSVYGPYEAKGRLVPTLISSAISGRAVPLASKKSVRDYVFVEDLIDAYLLAADKKTSGVFNIGSGKEYTTLQVFNLVKKIAGGKLRAKWNIQERRKFEPKHWVASNEKAMKLLGWKPKYNMEEGLLETYKWVSKNLSYYDQT